MSFLSFIWLYHDLKWHLSSTAESHILVAIFFSGTTALIRHNILICLFHFYPLHWMKHCSFSDNWMNTLPKLICSLYRNPKGQGIGLDKPTQCFTKTSWFLINQYSLSWCSLLSINEWQPLKLNTCMEYNLKQSQITETHDQPVVIIQCIGRGQIGIAGRVRNVENLLKELVCIENRLLSTSYDLCKQMRLD